MRRISPLKQPRRLAGRDDTAPCHGHNNRRFGESEALKQRMGFDDPASGESPSLEASHE
ncbi:hypothetical protein [Alcanivorax hongdengensis]|uniref:hypothetical protein n=1 Tax=Alcanivorax hongdengensis TaxID=519051 RepID=UPI0002F8B2E9|nr:hypothetical protein [Alcanivorax hongdengensis]